MSINNINDINSLEYKDKIYSVSVSGIAGLSVRVYPNGKKEYYLRYPHPHVEGKRPRIMLGKIDDISLYEVKHKAESILETVSKGIDPKAIDRQEKVNKYAHLKNATFSEIVQAWRDNKIASRHQGKSNKRAFSDSTLKFWDLCLGYMRDEIGDLRMNDITSEVILSVCEATLYTTKNKKAD